MPISFNDQTPKLEDKKTSGASSNCGTGVSFGFHLLISTLCGEEGKAFPFLEVPHAQLIRLLSIGRPICGSSLLYWQKTVGLLLELIAVWGRKSWESRLPWRGLLYASWYNLKQYNEICEKVWQKNIGKLLAENVYCFFFLFPVERKLYYDSLRHPFFSRCYFPPHFFSYFTETNKENKILKLAVNNFELVYICMMFISDF